MGMTQKTSFLSPRFTGERFTGHSLPLELLKDMAVLEELLIELAKSKYLEENQQRARVPKGFTNGVSLELTGLSAGSAIAQIDMSVESGDLFPQLAQGYFEQARDSLLDAIDAADQGTNITEHMPEKLLVYFDRLGRSLHDHETIEFRPLGRGAKAVLSKSTRRKLLLASSQVDELTDDIELRGSIPEANQVSMTFQLHPIVGPKVRASIESQHLETVLEAFNGYREGTRVVIQGIGKYTRNERLTAIERVEHISILDKNDPLARLEEFKLLKDGWLDGKALAPSHEKLDEFIRLYDENYSEADPTPFIYPTADGGVQLEWSAANFEASLEVGFKDFSGIWHCLDIQTDEDKEFRLELSDRDGWRELARLISASVRAKN